MDKVEGGKRQLTVDLQTSVPSNKVPEENRCDGYLEKSMVALGIGLNTRNVSCYSIFMIISATIVCFFITCTSHYTIDSIFDLFSSTTLKLWCLTFFLSTSSLYRFQYCKSQLLEIKFELYKLPKRNLLCTDAVRLCLPWFFATLNAFLMSWYAFTPEGMGLIKIWLSKSHLSDTVMRWLFIGGNILIIWLIFIPEALIHLFYVRGCSDIAERFKQFHGGFTHNSAFNIQRAVFLFVERYYRLCHLVDLLRGVYSPILFLYAFNIGIKLIVCINSTLIFTVGMTSLFYVATATVLFQQLYMFVDLCNVSTNLSTEACKITSMIYKESLSYDDSALREYVFRFFVHCAIDRPILIACKVLSVNRKLLLTVFSVSLTYLIVMYQLRQ